MRGNELLEKMELIDPAYVAAADAPPKKRKTRWLRWGAAAACLCLVIGGLWAAGKRGEPQPGPGSSEDPGPGVVNGLGVPGREPRAGGHGAHDPAGLPEREL